METRSKGSKLSIIDPMKFNSLLWPDDKVYDKQREIIYSVEENDMTVVPAGNMTGKDWIGGKIILSYFLRHWPCRIVTTSVKDDHLDVLWGEIGRFFNSSKVPLDYRLGGPLKLMQREMRRYINGERQDFEYVKGMVASDDTEASLQGHHAQYTLAVIDEASGVKASHFDMLQTWAKRVLIISNCWDCNNEFKWAVEGRPGTEDKGGDIPRPTGDNFYRKVIRIPADDSPNVKYAKAEIAAGREPTDTIVIPGVLTWGEYQKRRKLWDPIRQCVSLDAKFYKGSENLLYPPQWLDRAEEIARELLKRYKGDRNDIGERKAKAIGCDPAEGGDSSCWSVVDELGMIELVSLKTKNTNEVAHKTIELIHLYQLDPTFVMFDTGGGGKQHADRLREMGYPVRTVAFGEAASPVDRFKRYKSKGYKTDEVEQKYAYKNKRAEMYGLLRQLLNPVEAGFGIPARFVELRRQLAPMPLLFDGEGRMRMLPKNKNTANSTEQTLTELLGCSPDEADSLVIAVYSMLNDEIPFVARVY